MIYILYYEYSNTSGNHAGMAYLARYIKSSQKEVRLIKHISQDYKGGRYVGYLYAVLLTLYLFIKLRKKDKVFFMEYLSGNFAFQEKIAKGLRSMRKKNTFNGIVHLSGDHLKELYGSEENILKKLSPLTKVVVLGSSLKSFLKKIQYTNEVVCTFHYVDTHYYRPLKSVGEESNVLNILFIGNVKRNFEQLKEIIEALPDRTIHFHVCVGASQGSRSLNSFPNVTTYGFLEEGKLLEVMQKCNVNLSVLKDTIGSNAITCSLAVGLTQVVSDVGSIRDYCNESNAIFCHTTPDFIKALKDLTANPLKVKAMSESALARAEELSKENFIKEFTLINQ